MPNPLALLPASVKLRCSTAPPQVVTTDYEGQLVTVYKIMGVTTLPPAGASPTGTVTKTVTAITGSPYLFLAPGLTPTDVPVGATLSATEFSATTVVESRLADQTKTGCTFTNTGELVKIPTTASNDGLLVGAKVSGTSIAAGATIATVNNLKYTVSVVSNGSTTITVANGGTITLAAGQFVTINATNYTVSAAVTNVNSFVIVGTPPTAGTYTATIGALLTLSAAAVTADQASQTLTVGGHIRMVDVAIGALTSGSYAFNTYDAIRTFSDVREGDYFEMAIGTAVNPASMPDTYVYLHGYVRRPDSATNTFLVWSAETGGSPVSQVDTNVPWFVTAVTSEAPYINVYQKRSLPFAYQKNTKLAGRLAATPALTFGARPPAIMPGRLRGRLVSAPMLQGLDATQYARPRRTPLVGRMVTVPGLVLIQKNLPVYAASLSGRVPVPPKLAGGYLRFPPQLSRGVLGCTPFRMLNNGQDFGARGRLQGRVPMARLTGHEQFRRVPVIRALVNGTATFVILGRGLSVRDAVADCLGIWNLRYTPRSCTADEVKERAIADLNAALQIIYSRARHLDYFNKTTVTIQVPANARTKELPITVQTVLGTVRLKNSENADTSVPLLAATSLADVQQFGSLYGGAGTSPYCYFIDRRSRAEANVVSSVLMLAPVPTSTVYVDLEIASEAPRYTWQDVVQATPLQLPSTYAESLLLPIVRQRATSFRLFTNEPLRGVIESQYRKAQQALGLLDPAPDQAARPQTKNVGGLE